MIITDVACNSIAVSDFKMNIFQAYTEGIALSIFFPILYFANFLLSLNSYISGYYRQNNQIVFFFVRNNQNPLTVKPNRNHSTQSSGYQSLNTLLEFQEVILLNESEGLLLQ